MAHEELLLAILEAARKEYSIDETRLYLTGLSMGGFGTWRLGAKHPKLFAALAPICGGGDPSEAAALKDLPIWAFHGDQDKAVPHALSVRMVEAVKAAGGTPKLTIYPGVGHNSWDKAYREENLAEWFLQHRRP
jgi:predicted peptidase